MKKIVTQSSDNILINIVIAFISFLTVIFLSSHRKSGNKKRRKSFIKRTCSVFSFFSGLMTAFSTYRKKQTVVNTENENGAGVSIEKSVIIDI